MIQKLLRATLWRETLSLPKESPDWCVLINELQRQTVLELTAPTIFSIKNEAKPQEQLVWQLTCDYLLNQKTYKQHCLFIAELVSAMQEAGCHPILLKGVAVARYYPIPQDRRCGDIDIYVPKVEYPTALEVLKRYATQEQIAHAIEFNEHYQIFIGEIEVELHHIANGLTDNPNNPDLQQMANHWLLPERSTYINIEGKELLVPHPQYEIVYLLAHLWHHFAEINGIGLRQICDLAMMLHNRHEEILPELLEQDLQYLQLYDIWQTVAWILVDWIGLPKEECPCYNPRRSREGKKLLKYVMIEGNFGAGGLEFKRTIKEKHPITHKMHSYLYYGKRKWLIDTLEVGRMTALKKHVLWTRKKVREQEKA